MDIFQTTLMLLLLTVVDSFTQMRDKQTDTRSWLQTGRKLSGSYIPNTKLNNHFQNTKPAPNSDNKIHLTDNYLQSVIFPEKVVMKNSRKTTKNVIPSGNEAKLKKQTNLNAKTTDHFVSIHKYSLNIPTTQLKEDVQAKGDYKNTNTTLDNTINDKDVEINTTHQKLSSEKGIPIQLSNPTKILQNTAFTNSGSSVQKRSLGDPSSCVMDVTEVDINIRETVDDDHTSYVLECVGQIQVQKCEGMCTSRVSPSVNHYDGFLRECSCCKEETTVYRDVTLTTCFIGTEETHGRSLTRRIAEPSGCSCQMCRN